MPYTTERGGHSYSDHETPPEHATGADEEAAAFNDAVDAAYADTEELYGLLDEIEDGQGNKLAAMQAIRAKVAEALALVRAL